MRTHVFFGTKAVSDAVVGLEFLSDKPLGIGVGHGWTPASRAFRVTEVDGMRLRSLNGMPAIEAFEEHARMTNQPFDPATPLPFFLHNILGIDTGNGYRLRVPLKISEHGAVECATEIPAGARVHIMKTTADTAITAASNATASAVQALNGEKPKAALFFDCVATRLRMGEVFGFELTSVAQMLGGAELEHEHCRRARRAGDRRRPGGQPPSSGRGLGLGLAIVKNLVSLHGGSVRVESEGRGNGSVFIVELPASTTTAVTRTPVRLTQPGLRVARSTKRVLVVDDNEDAAELLSLALSAQGYALETAFDGPSALQIAKDFRPHVAVLDIGLPVMDGYELARRLREQCGDVLRLVALTGYGHLADKERASDAGFDAHLVKPVALARLQDLLDELTS